MSMRRLLPLIFVSVVASACSDARPERTGTTRAAILRGAVSGPEEDAVVTVGIYEARSLCSGTLVAPNLVLTARHCVSRLLREDAFACKPDGTLVGPDGGVVTQSVGADYTPSKIYVWTGNERVVLTPKIEGRAYGKSIVHDGQATLCGHDLAFVVLDRALTGVPIAPLRLAKHASAGEVLEAIGFGETETGELPSKRMKRNDLVVQEVGPWASGSGYGLAPNELFVGEAICDGDSGGPVIAKSGAVVGVASRGHGGSGPSQCERAISVFTDTGGFEAVAREAFRQAEATPWLEGEPAPGTAEPEEASDAGGAAPPATTPPEPSAGCSMGRPAPRGRWGIALVVALALLRRRRADRGDAKLWREPTRAIDG